MSQNFIPTASVLDSVRASLLAPYTLGQEAPKDSIAALEFISVHFFAFLINWANACLLAFSRILRLLHLMHCASNGKSLSGGNLSNHVLFQSPEPCHS